MSRAPRSLVPDRVRRAAGFAAPLLLSACALAGGRSGAPPATSDPRFDWFEYRGSDPVHEQVQAGPGEYLNPVLAGFYPDPSVTRVGDDYYLVTATDPAGPWSDPVWLPEIDGIDPSLFWDDDGRAYVLNNGPPVGRPLYEGHRAIWIQEFDPAAKRLVGFGSAFVGTMLGLYAYREAPAAPR